MSGITGIILKGTGSNLDKYRRALKSMMKSLSYSTIQKCNTFVGERILFGNVVPISHKKNDRYIVSDTLQIFCVVEGLLFISEQDRSQVILKFGLMDSLSDYDLIPYLYVTYKNSLPEYLSGWYNIFIYSRNDSRAQLFNDRLGYLPLYIYESGSVFIFASKIESLLASNILPYISFDEVTLIEHLLFNYPLSDNTYIKNINTLTNATSVCFEKDSVLMRKYWGMSELFGLEPINSRDSYMILQDGLKDSVKKITNRYDSMNLSLTGGWDSRLVLSFLLPEHKDEIVAYSFGARNSSDIEIPSLISKAEAIEYTAYVLDEHYLNKHFLTEAKKTIHLSGGTRNYKRSHYIYAIEKVAANSDLLITGIFGDEVLKVGRPRGGNVLSSNAITLIQNHFNVRVLEETIRTYLDKMDSQANYEGIFEELNERMLKINTNLGSLETLNEKYFAFRFEVNLRKYFGNEANSYNDFAYSYSPFMDYDFLLELAKTSFWGSRFSFNSNNIFLKRRSTMLYHNLLKDNYYALANYNSSRNFSVRDAATIFGNTKILYKKFFSNKRLILDDYNTAPSDSIFYDSLDSEKQESNPLYMVKPSETKSADINSLHFWINETAKKYL